MRRSEIESYIYEEVVPRYSAFDDAHKEDHALTVIRQSEKLLESRDAWLAEHSDAEGIWSAPVDPLMLLTAAACHDLGLVNGRDNHHTDSGAIIRADKRLRRWFSGQEIETIAQAAEDHRASGKGAPRSIYGMMVAEADRVIDADTIIRRTIQYGLKHYPDIQGEKLIGRAIEHLKEKYGRGGYLRLWIPWSDNAARLNSLQDLIADPEGIEKKVTDIYRKLTMKKI